ncbi:replication factor A1 [Haloarcula vallismortis]|uniref:Nucleic acid binding OB-fold tRNA/helicase-type n=2 Tax=Haloarcula vallismortis TaxID=28442 RepID=M0JRK5_HALVA|nr:OB-fold nucleic acid binding domain-containing protein [Haloarcula vallismortis]EMA11596.1 nucleic acid binding OB-fold tRNA/helicase-type [Haloarcula vallismortis ATCC 29715]SDW45835.1 replication factor A1 [Haloarcula vallismortis]
MNDVELVATVTKIYSTNHYDGGKVRNLTVEDETGKTRVTLWDEDTELADHIYRNDKIKITGGYTKESDYSPNGVEIHLGDDAGLELYEKEEQLK